jgi:hypothetical protein
MCKTSGNSTLPPRSKAAVYVAVDLAHPAVDTQYKTLHSTTGFAQDARAPRSSCYSARLPRLTQPLPLSQFRYITTTLLTIAPATHSQLLTSRSSMLKLPRKAVWNFRANLLHISSHRKVTAGCLPYMKNPHMSVHRPSRLQKKCGKRSAGEVFRLL